jgi:hypothetical protein
MSALAIREKKEERRTTLIRPKERSSKGLAPRSWELRQAQRSNTALPSNPSSFQQTEEQIAGRTCQPCSDLALISSHGLPEDYPASFVQGTGGHKGRSQGHSDGEAGGLPTRRSGDPGREKGELHDSRPCAWGLTWGVFERGHAPLVVRPQRQILHSKPQVTGGFRCAPSYPFLSQGDIILRFHFSVPSPPRPQSTERIPN